MLNRLKLSRKTVLVLLIMAVLAPFTCRQLLAFGLHVSRTFNTCVYTNGAAGHHGARHLMRQLEVQALDQDKTNPILLPFSSPAILGEGSFPRRVLTVVYLSKFVREAFPSGDSVSLRI